MKVLSYYAGIDYKIGLAVSYNTVVHIIFQSDSVIISTRAKVAGIEPVTLLVVYHAVQHLLGALTSLAAMCEETMNQIYKAERTR